MEDAHERKAQMCTQPVFYNFQQTYHSVGGLEPIVSLQSHNICFVSNK